MDIYTTLPEIEALEIKYGAYPEKDKNILLEKINAFCSEFFNAVPKELLQGWNNFLIDILPTNKIYLTL